MDAGSFYVMELFPNLDSILSYGAHAHGII